MDTINESEQISALIPVRIYNALQLAAEIKGESVDHFMIQAAFEKAKEIIDKERIMRKNIRRSFPPQSSRALR